MASTSMGSVEDLQHMGSGTNNVPNDGAVPGSPIVQPASGPASVPGSVVLEDSLPSPNPRSPPAPDPFASARPLNARHNTAKRAKCSISYFRRELGTRVRMERTHPSVFDMITSNTALAAMDEKWKLVKPEVKPDFRWIHLPANDPDWVEVCVILSGSNSC